MKRLLIEESTVLLVYDIQHKRSREERKNQNRSRVQVEQRAANNKII